MEKNPDRANKRGIKNNGDPAFPWTEEEKGLTINLTGRGWVGLRWLGGESLSQAQRAG